MTTGMIEQSEVAAKQDADRRLNDLEQIIHAYHAATENLQQSHEHLRQQVARLQEELAGANAQLQRSKRLAALGEMAAGIAHEVRNPLAAIGLYARMIGEDLTVEGDPVKWATKRDLAAENACKIADAVRGLDGIVRDVLTFAGEVSPRVGILCCTELLKRALATHRPVIEQHDIAVSMNVEEDLVIAADSDLLHQALLNLVRNATDAMQRGGGTLTLAAKRNEQGVTFTVRDTGPGIDEDAIDRIFNPFFTTRGTGTGLGLAIVHRIIDAHGGAINVFNDGGAVFELTLPSRIENQAGANA